MDTIYNVPESISIKDTIIAFHGGCFTGGNTTWDKDQNQLLADMGYEVHQVAFPKEINKFVFWVADFDFSKIRWKPIYVIGRFLFYIFVHFLIQS